MHSPINKYPYLLKINMEMVGIWAEFYGYQLKAFLHVLLFIPPPTQFQEEQASSGEVSHRGTGMFCWMHRSRRANSTSLCLWVSVHALDLSVCVHDERDDVAPGVKHMIYMC